MENEFVLRARIKRLEDLVTALNSLLAGEVTLPSGATGVYGSRAHWEGDREGEIYVRYTIGGVSHSISAREIIERANGAQDLID